MNQKLRSPFAEFLAGIVVRPLAFVALLLLALSTLMHPAAAQDFPSKPIRWISTSGAGGAFYNLAQGLAPALSKELGVEVVVEAAPGPDGWNRVFLSEPDGHTIGIGDPVGEFANAAVNTLPYDPARLTWIGRLNSAANLIVASKQSGFTSLDDIKKSGQPLRIATFGVTAPLVQLLLLSEATGIAVTPVNFRTPGDVVFGLVRGDVDVANLGVQNWADHIQAGNAVPILLWSDQANATLTDVPTLPGADLPALVSFMTQRSIIAPPGLPADIEQKLAAAFAKIVSEGEGLEFLERANFERNSLFGPEFKEIVNQVSESISSEAETLKTFVSQ